LRSGCQEYRLSVQEPEQPPIAFAACIPGTGDAQTRAPWCNKILSNLRAEGLRTVTLTYPPLKELTCSGLAQKAAILQADVNAAAGGLPIVLVAGSQGAWIAGQMQAKAAVLYSDGIHVVSPVSLDLSCNANAKPQYVVAISGASDSVYAHPLQPQLAAITGAVCDRSPCGSQLRGWMIVSDNQTASGSATHKLLEDRAWAPTGEPWGMLASVAWLTWALEAP
jgi:hypothetical protein